MHVNPNMRPMSALRGGRFTQYVFGVRETEGTLHLLYTAVLFHLYETVSLGVIQHILVNSFYTQAWWENICEFYDLEIHTPFSEVVFFS